MDTAKLVGDGLDLRPLAGSVGQVASVIGGNDFELLHATTQRELLDALAELASCRRTFDVVMLIGHSNEAGIRIASDTFATWPALAQYLKPFKPRRLVLVACAAGRWPAAQALFRGLPPLRRIYASPVLATLGAGKAMVTSLLYLVMNRRPRATDVLWFQALAALGTGTQIREWQRNADMDDPEGRLLDLAAVALDRPLRDLAASVRQMLR